MVGLVETLIALLEGEANIGGAGAATIVVKLDIVEYELIPLTLIALTRQ